MSYSYSHSHCCGPSFHQWVKLLAEVRGHVESSLAPARPAKFICRASRTLLSSIAHHGRRRRLCCRVALSKAKRPGDNRLHHRYPVPWCRRQPPENSSCRGLVARKVLRYEMKSKAPLARIGGTLHNNMISDGGTEII